MRQKERRWMAEREQSREVREEEGTEDSPKNAERIGSKREHTCGHTGLERLP